MSLLSFSAIWAILVRFLAWKRTSDKTIVWATCGFDFSTNLCLRFATNNNLHGLAPDLHQLASTALWTCSNLIESFSFFSFEQSQSHIFSHTVDLNKNKSNFLIVQLANLPWKFLNNLHQLAWIGVFKQRHSFKSKLASSCILFWTGYKSVMNASSLF